MITFRGLHIENFFSHVDTAIPLTGQGVVLIAGRVHGDSAANSNGAGKSALLPEALLFGLFGRTLHGIRGEDVVRRGAEKPCTVQVWATTDDGTPVHIERVQGAAARRSRVRVGTNAYHNGAEAIDRVVQTALGLRFDTFTATAIYGRGTTPFFTQLGDAARKEILDDLLAFQDLNRFHLEAKRRTQQVESSRALKTEALKSFALRQADLERLVAECTKREAEFTAAREDELALVDQKATTLQAHAAKLVEQQNEIAAEHEANTQCLAPLERDLALVQAHLRKLQTEQDELASTLREVKSERARYAAECARIRQLDGPCPTCAQPVPPEHRTRLLNERTNLVATADAVFAELETKQQLLQKIASEQRLRETALELEISPIRERLARLQHAAEYLTHEATSISTRQHDLKQQRAQVATRENDAARLRVSALESLESVRKEARAVESELAALVYVSPYVHFWEEGFSNAGLKSMLLDEVMPFLNERAAVYADQLADGTLNVRFQTQAATKSGELRERCHVAVSHQLGGASYKACSDGQRRRADLIATLALGDLAARRASRPVNLVILDEVFDGLDDTGMGRVFPVLTDLAKHRSSVFVVTHNDSLAQLFPTVWTVVNDGGAARVEGAPAWGR